MAKTKPAKKEKAPGVWLGPTTKPANGLKQQLNDVLRYDKTYFKNHVPNFEYYRDKGRIVCLIRFVACMYAKNTQRRRSLPT